MTPTSDTQNAVNAWLAAHGLNATTISSAGDWLSMHISVAQANALFDADFTVYKDKKTGKEAVRTMSYSLPSELQGHVDLVYPTVT